MPRKKTQLAIDHGKCCSSTSPMLSFSDTYPRASLTHPPAAPYRIVQDNYKGLYGGQLWGYAAQSQSLCVVAPHEAAQIPHQPQLNWHHCSYICSLHIHLIFFSVSKHVSTSQQIAMLHISLCCLGFDQPRNLNMNNKDDQVGQLTKHRHTLVNLKVASCTLLNLIWNRSF